MNYGILILYRKKSPLFVEKSPYLSALSGNMVIVQNMKVIKKKTSHHNWRPFEDARIYAQNLGLKTLREWKAWAKSSARPDDIPANPRNIYIGNGWVSIGDWLGSGYIYNREKIFRPFKEARTFVRGLGLKNIYEWRAWVKSSDRPDDIPILPWRNYKNKGWAGLYDWLGSVPIARKKVFRPFEEAREYTQSLGLKNCHEWEVWAASGARPDDIPYNPKRVYEGKGWVSFGDWLGTGHIATCKRVFRPFKEARTFVRSLGLKNIYEWRAWVKSSDRPDDIPVLPWINYKNKGWAGLYDWLGSDPNARKKVFRPFEEARAYAQSIGLKNCHEWEIWAARGARPVDIPSSPKDVYKVQGWISFGDWLGTGHIDYKKKVFRSFSYARAFVRSLGLKNIYDWKVWLKSPERPVDIPYAPNKTYKDMGWMGFRDWLGTGRITRSKRKVQSHSTD